MMERRAAKVGLGDPAYLVADELNRAMRVVQSYVTSG